MKTLKRMELVERLNKAPVPNAPEKVVLYKISNHDPPFRTRAISPNQQHQTQRRDLCKLQPPQPLDRPLLPRPPHPLPNHQRQHDAQPELLRDVGVHVPQRARARGPPGVEGRGRGHEAEDEQRGEEGAGDVAEDDGDDGGGLVAAGGARHDDVGGDGGGQAGRGEEADEDGEGWGAGG